MNDYEYYLINCNLYKKTHYMIYRSSNVDSILAEGVCHIVFRDLNMLLNYVTKNQISLVNRDSVIHYDFDYVVDFCQASNAILKKPRELMDCWNLLDDIGESSCDIWFFFNKMSKSVRGLHEKLLFSSDIYLEKNEVNIAFNEHDIKELKKLLTLGMKLFLDNSIIK